MGAAIFHYINHGMILTFHSIFISLLLLVIYISSTSLTHYSTPFQLHQSILTLIRLANVLIS